MPPHLGTELVASHRLVEDPVALEALQPEIRIIAIVGLFNDELFLWILAPE
jgi:hypothetical protein